MSTIIVYGTSGESIRRWGGCKDVVWPETGAVISEVSVSYPRRVTFTSEMGKRVTVAADVIVVEE